MSDSRIVTRENRNAGAGKRADVKLVQIYCIYQSTLRLGDQPTFAGNSLLSATLGHLYVFLRIDLDRVWVGLCESAQDYEFFWILEGCKFSR
jgi:hypothetical protein